MKIFLMSLIFGITFSVVLSANSAFAAELEINSVVCGTTQDIEGWGLTTSYDRYNGQRDRNSVLEIRFIPTVENGRSLSIRHSYKLPAIKWDKNFKYAHYVEGDFPVMCAKRGLFGIKTLKRNCYLESNFSEFKEIKDCSQGIGRVFRAKLIVVD